MTSISLFLSIWSGYTYGHIHNIIYTYKVQPWHLYFYSRAYGHITLVNASWVFSSTSGLERYWWTFCRKWPSWNASSLICCCAFFVGALYDWRQAICRHYFSVSAFFALIYPVYDISYSQFFCNVFIIYIFLLVSVGQRVVLNSISRFFVERVPEVFLQHMRMRHGWWKICLTAVIRMRTLCKHIFASAERKFNTVIPSLGDTLRTLMQECFKNIKWRDVDKKIWSFTFLET